MLLANDSDTSSMFSRKTITLESVIVEGSTNIYNYIDTPGYSESNSIEWIEDMVDYIKDKVIT